MHFIPTYSSWLNQVERFFALITDKAIRRGSLTSVKQLVQRIDQFVTHHNANSQPFKWTATADSILEKLHRSSAQAFAYMPTSITPSPSVGCGLYSQTSTYESRNMATSSERDACDLLDQDHKEVKAKFKEYEDCLMKKSSTPAPWT